MKIRFCAAVTLLAATGPAFAATAPAKPQEIFYRAPAGKGTQLVAAARDGSNVSSLFSGTGSLYFNFDVGSADSGKIVITTRAGELQLLTYAKNSSGVFYRTGLTTLLTGLPGGTALDLSPDGTRVAYRGGDGTRLMVYTIGDAAPVEWDSGIYVWDLVWARGGASIVYMDHAASGTLTNLYEVTGPGQRTQVFSKKYMDRVEVSRKDGDVLLLSYNSDDGQQSLVGTWRLPSGSTPGDWVEQSLAGQPVANRGVLACDDAYLIYGSSGHAGAQIWYSRTLPSGADVLINKAGSNAEPQSWSSCPSTALQFRVVK